MPMLKFRNRLLDATAFIPPGICSADGDPPQNTSGDPPKPKDQNAPPSKFDDAPPKGQEVFSREYVEELRSENKGWRLKMAGERTAREAAETALETEKKTFADKLKAADTGATEKVTAAQKAADDRVIRAELRAVATKAGMIDLDGLKLADTTGLKLKDDGTVEGADALMTALKTAKPYLFGTGKGTSSTDLPPKPKDDTKKSALDLSPEEFTANMRLIDAGKIPA